MVWYDIRRMDIKYLGHSSFKLKGKTMTVITDPFDSKMVGIPYAKMVADVVSVSHQHPDHNDLSKVSATPGREEVFVVNRPGEYEVGGVGMMGIRTWHDDKEGAERGENVIFTFTIDGVIVCHLGDLGHSLSERQVELIGDIDVLLVPVGGGYTIGPSQAVQVIEALSPSIVVPMHYKVSGMGDGFSELVTVDEFLEKAGYGGAKKEDKLSVTKGSLPEEMEVVVLSL